MREGTVPVGDSYTNAEVPISQIAHRASGYPSDADFDFSRVVEGHRARREADWSRMPWIGFVVSQGWKDEDWIEAFVDKLAAKYPGTTMIVPDRAAGAMKTAVQRAMDQDFKLIEIPSEAQWGNYRQAVQATNVVLLADVVMIAWAGGSDLPKAVVDKALLLHRPADKFLPGLHLYEQTKTRKTKSREAQFTGQVKYRTRKDAHLIERKAA